MPVTRIKINKPKVFLPKTRWEKFTFFTKGFKIYDTGWNEHPQLIYCKDEPIQYGGGGIGWNRVLHPAGSITLPQRQYWCCDCGNQLEDGPEGGCAVNVVCKTCRLNYGCLPDYDPRYTKDYENVYTCDMCGTPATRWGHFDGDKTGKEYFCSNCKPTEGVNGYSKSLK